jgi:macrolide-specific efflux system membrane fusion protein
VVLVVIGGLAWWMVKEKNGSTPTALRTVMVTRGDVALTILATGVVEPQNRVEIKPPIAGRIEDVLVVEGQDVKKGEILAWMSSTDRAALLDAARARGDAELARWQDLYKAAPLLAPLDGVIIARKVEPGQTVTAADTVLVLSDRLIVKAQVDETDIGQVVEKQEAEIDLDAYPGQVIAARVDHIAYEAETVNNVTVYQVDVLPERVPEFMRSGMTADVTFHVRKITDVLTLPTEAVRVTEEGATVQVAGGRPQDAPRTVPVETGLDNGKVIEVTSGVSEGQAVLVPSFELPRIKSTGSNPLVPSHPPGRRR